MRTQPHLLFFFLVLITLAHAPAESVLQWSGGSGAWNLSEPNWLSEASAPQSWPGDGSAVAHFGDTGGGLVQVSGMLAAAGIQFAADGYTLNLNHQNSISSRHKEFLIANLNAPRSGCGHRSPGFPTQEGTPGSPPKGSRTLKGCFTDPPTPQGEAVLQTAASS